ncbi:Fe(3+) ions import ATP-binding protein FbpC 2 [Paraburkholderia domus]|jgi:ABC-type spermidine/putrescine transport systems, ATPase components|uniref:Fe(3+) ions import ATP-binding protein FbpC 2 n=1 Tax=Paraburkholderia domus TaxID=2793075 RepID=A0A9N8N6E2_9BURK|nr:ABC transporter ATP-binding protein [Paraburkholderia domus]MBK5053419.1 ABC transporter ATP-binding protein [Burkholderia sp. R-70006]MBK5065277.1 ABC transporter ATP-binding protein [Burkholderia sp. R-70199]MBK5090419.1 ABC transporter ATP-binding protein [Burkholderia sp. R-69927]MBK5125222.1 ABC transporter ATP-binding protein [Burkholderia sp. R-69980]MBK5169317.1 ABC transporter ATP-binding protein [Burkholderia sp. R-70211]MBK5184582.1 ABC transporter ATP-binding protein [Burkholde
MSELRIRGLQKSFDGHPVLHGIDLSVERGTLLALLGPSGSGKTTLLRLLCGFERADSGSVEIDGNRVVGDNLHVPSEQRRIGYVPQEGALFPHLSVADNIVFGLPRTQRRARHRVAELLELVGLPANFGERAPQQLSGGQQQRVALARALAPSPTLVMLDEPFSSLDAALRLETRQAVASALAATGATAVLVTHDQSEALSLGHEVAVLWNGRLIQTATPETLYRRPVTRELASFVGEAVLLPGVVNQDRVSCELGDLPLCAPTGNGAVDVMVRPEQIRLLRADETMPNGAASHDAVVQEVIFQGQDAGVTLQLQSGARTVVRARVPGYQSPRPGERVRLAVDGEVTAYPRG